MVYSVVTEPAFICMMILSDREQQLTLNPEHRCELCLFGFRCLFDRKLIQSVVCLIARPSATILAFWL